MSEEYVYNLKDPNDIYKLREAASFGNNVVKIRDNDSSELAIGVVIPKDHPSALTYLKDVADYNDTNKDIYAQIELSRKLYIWETVVGQVIDLYVDFSHSDFKIENVEGKPLELIKFFLKNINKGNNNVSTGIRSLSRHCALEFYLTGNVFPHSRWAQTYVKPLNGKYKLPTSIITLDPMIIEIPEETVQFGNKKMYISFSRVFGDKNRYDRDAQKRILSSLPVKIRHKFDGKFETGIELDPYFTYHIKRKGSMYSGWGKPYLTRSFSAIASKRKLRALDDSTIDGMINSITIFKVGDKDHRETWSQTRLNAFKNLMKNPSASMHLIWSWDVETEHIGPEGDVLNFSDRYKDANHDILQALGVPQSILTGEGNRAGDVWAAVRFWTERVGEFREEFQSFIEDMLQKVMIENGFEDEEPRIRFHKPRVNREDIRNILLALWDRGLLSHETLLEEAGFDRDTESFRRDTEKSDGFDTSLSRREVPYSPKGKSPNPETDTSKKSVEKTNTKKETKVTDVNEKQKGIPLKIQGNTRDNVVSLISYAIEESGTLIDAKRDLKKFVDHIYFTSGSYDFENEINLPKKEFKEIVKYCTANVGKTKDFREIIIDKVEEYFRQKSD